MANTLAHFIPSPVVAVIAYYDGTGAVAHVCGVTVKNNDSLKLHIACRHKLTLGQRVTVHLDNRTGVSDYDAKLRVYRLSYKGRIKSLEAGALVIEPVEFQVYYGISVEYEFAKPGYQFPADPRASRPLPLSPLIKEPEDDPDEHENKVGVVRPVDLCCSSFVQSEPF